MPDTTIHTRAEVWLDSAIYRQERLLQQLHFSRGRLKTAREQGRPNDAISAVAAAANDIAWTLANCQMGSVVMVASGRMEADR